MARVDGVGIEIPVMVRLAPDHQVVRRSGEGEVARVAAGGLEQLEPASSLECEFRSIVITDSV